MRVGAQGRPLSRGAPPRVHSRFPCDDRAGIEVDGCPSSCRARSEDLRSLPASRGRDSRSSAIDIHQRVTARARARAAPIPRVLTLT